MILINKMSACKTSRVMLGFNVDEKFEILIMIKSAIKFKMK